MRNSFSGFYPLTEGDFDKLWEEALIVLDANAILDLYRLPPMARDDFFSVLEHYRQRLWIPYQVGIEVQRNRFSVIADRQKNTDSAMKQASAAFENLKETVQRLKLDRYRTDLNPLETVAKLEGPFEELLQAIREAKKDELQISSNDPVRDRIDKIFENRIGAEPVSQDEIDTFCKDGDKRYEDAIPPGFQDSVKKDQFFIHNGIRYLSKFGDLILWRQLLKHLKEQGGITSVMLITSDKKSDWWWKVTEGGNRTIGPHPELKSEIKREAKVDLFWMYTADDFLERSAEYRNEKVAETSVQELRDIVNRDDGVVSGGTYDLDIYAEPEEPVLSGRAPDWALARTNPLIGMWLQINRGDVTNSLYGPDFAVSTPDGMDIGYMVMRIPHFTRDGHIPQSMVERILTVKRSINMRQQAHLALILLIDGKPLNLVEGSKRRSQIKSALKTWASAIGLHEIIVGTITDHRFHFVMEYPEVGDTPTSGPSIFD